MHTMLLCLVFLVIWLWNSEPNVVATILATHFVLGSKFFADHRWTAVENKNIVARKPVFWAIVFIWWDFVELIWNSGEDLISPSMFHLGRFTNRWQNRRFHPQRSHRFPVKRGEDCVLAGGVDVSVAETLGGFLAAQRQYERLGFLERKSISGCTVIYALASLIRWLGFE